MESMKILCFSDLHCDRKAAERLVKMASNADWVIGAGDFSIQHRGLADTLDVLAAIARPAVLVPGNGETVEELAEAAKIWPTATVLHGSGTCIQLQDRPKTRVWGVGGGIPKTPFGEWSYDFDERQAESMLTGGGDADVLVVHSPPLNTVDVDATGKIQGSLAIRNHVEQHTPRLVVCGHIHSSWTRQMRLGESLILNAGPGGVMIELE